VLLPFGAVEYQTYIRRESVALLLASMCFFVLSLLSKAMAACLPLVLFLLDYAAGRKWSMRLLLEKIPGFHLSALFGFHAINVQQGRECAGQRYIFIVQRTLHALYGFIAYILKLLIPLNLSAFYPYPYELQKSSWVENSTPASLYGSAFISLAILAALIVGILRPRKRSKILVFGWRFMLHHRARAAVPSGRPRDHGGQVCVHSIHRHPVRHRILSECVV